MKTKAHKRYKSLITGEPFVGVTTVCDLHSKPALIVWANRLGLQGIDSTKFKDDKADIGTLAHAMITDYLTGKKTDTSDFTANQISLAENAVLSFFNWEKQHKLEVIAVEMDLVSEQFKYGGCCDIYAKVDGVLELLDLKTGSGIYPEHFTQVGGGYKHLLIENEKPVERVRILNIPRAENENFIEATMPENCDLHWQIFYHLLQVYYCEKELKELVKTNQSGQLVAERGAK